MFERLIARFRKRKPTLERLEPSLDPHCHLVNGSQSAGKGPRSAARPRLGVVPRGGLEMPLQRRQGAQERRLADSTPLHSSLEPIASPAGSDAVAYAMLSQYHPFTDADPVPTRSPSCGEERNQVTGWDNSSGCDWSATSSTSSSVSDSPASSPSDTGTTSND